MAAALRRPEYNFIRARQSPKSIHHARRLIKKPLVETNGILNKVLEQWALDLGLGSSEESIERLKQALDRHCESQYDMAELLGHESTEMPNAICVAICFACLKQLVELIPQHDMLRTVVYEGLLNAVYCNYNGNVSYDQNFMYSDLARSNQDEYDELNKAKFGENYQAIKNMLIHQPKTRFTETILTLLDDKINQSVVMNTFEALKTSTDRQQCLEHLALRLSSTERRDLLQFLMEDAILKDQTGAREVLRKTDALKKLHSNKSKLPNIEAKRRTSVAGRRGPHIPSLTRRGAIFSAITEASGRQNLMRRVSSINAPLEKRRSTRLAEKEIEKNGGHLDADYIQEKLEQIKASMRQPCDEKGSMEAQEELNRVMVYLTTGCKVDEAARRRSMQITAFQSKELANFEEDRIVEEDNEADMTRITRELTDNPELLGYIIKHSPNLLMQSIQEHPGILKYYILRHGVLVKSFLKLDAVASEPLDRMIKSKNYLPVLWSNDMKRKASESTSSIEYTLKWVEMNLDDVRTVILMRSDIAKKIFEFMNPESPAAQQFAQMMLNLPAFDALRANLTTIGFENAMRQDRTAVLGMIETIFQAEENSEMLENLKQCPNLLLTLCSMSSDTLRRMISDDLTGWKSFLVRLVTTNSFIMQDCLLSTTKGLLGQKEVLELNHEVVNKRYVPPVQVDSEDMITAIHNKMMDSTMVGNRRVRPRPSVMQIRPPPLQQLVLESDDDDDDEEEEEEAAETTPVVEEIQEVQPEIQQVRKEIEAEIEFLADMNAELHKDDPPDEIIVPFEAEAYPSRESTPKIAEEVPVVDEEVVDDEEVDEEEEEEEEEVKEEEEVVEMELNDEFLRKLKLSPKWIKVLGSGWKHRVKNAAEKRHVIRDKRQLKQLILEIYIDRLKIGLAGKEPYIGADFSTFVCDYLLKKYDDKTIVTYHLVDFISMIPTYYTDLRVSSFVAACKLGLNPREGSDYIINQYFYSLCQILFVKLQVYQVGNKIAMFPDGSNAIDLQGSVEVVNDVFHDRLNDRDLEKLEFKVRRLPKLSTQEISLDHLLELMIEEHVELNAQVESEYLKTFENRVSGKRYLSTSAMIEIIPSYLDIPAVKQLLSTFGKDNWTSADFLRLAHHFDSRFFVPTLHEVLNFKQLEKLKASLGKSSVVSYQDALKSIKALWGELQLNLNCKMISEDLRKRLKVAIGTDLEEAETSIVILSGDSQDESLNLVFGTFRHSVTTSYKALLVKSKVTSLTMVRFFQRWITRGRRRYQEQQQAKQNSNAKY